MLQPSSRLYYGLQAVIDLARRPEGMPVSAREIAACQGISDKYLESLLSMLRGAGLIQSLRGSGGGHVLAKAPGEITLRVVFQALEGAPAASPNVAACEPAERCVTTRAWDRVIAGALAVMDSITIADLIQECDSLNASDSLTYHI